MSEVKRYWVPCGTLEDQSGWHPDDNEVVLAGEHDRELAALREELVEVRKAVTNSTRELVDLRKSLTAAEQRNAELVEWCAKKCEERAAYYESGDDDAPGSRRAGACQNCADVIRWNKPTESGASE